MGASQNIVGLSFCVSLRSKCAKMQLNTQPRVGGYILEPVFNLINMSLCLLAIYFTNACVVLNT